MLNYTFDVGGTGIKYILFNNKESIDSGYIPFIKEDSAKIEHFQINLEDILKKISLILDNATDNFNLFISFPGVVDTHKNRIITESAIKNIDIDLSVYFKKYKNIKKMIFMNDAKAAVLGEYDYRTNQVSNKQVIENMIHLTIGTAIGSGIIINNQLYNGAGLQAGEMSKIFSSINNQDHSNAALDASIGFVLMKYLLQTGKKITGEEFFELFNKGDALVTIMMNDFITSLAKLIINLNYIFDYDLLTIGGGISNNDQFIELLKNKIVEFKDFYWEEKLFYSNEKVLPKFDVSILKNKAACYGGLMLLTKEREQYE